MRSSTLLALGIGGVAAYFLVTDGASIWRSLSAPPPAPTMQGIGNYIATTGRRAFVHG